MLNDLFGKVEASFKSYDDHLENWGCLEEAMGDGDIAYSSASLATAKNATNEAKEKLKSACHKFFSEVIWSAEIANLTLTEFLDDDKKLSEQWERVSSIVEDTFSREVLWEVQNK